MTASTHIAAEEIDHNQPAGSCRTHSPNSEDSRTLATQHANNKTNVWHYKESSMSYFLGKSFATLHTDC